MRIASAPLNTRAETAERGSTFLVVGVVVEVVPATCPRARVERTVLRPAEERRARAERQREGSVAWVVMPRRTEPTAIVWAVVVAVVVPRRPRVVVGSGVLSKSLG